MIELKEWIKDGITIDKRDDGYSVFTIPTQHFVVKELDELTPERFAAEVKKRQEYYKLQDELFKDLFD
jgi:hypothetical protein